MATNWEVELSALGQSHLLNGIKDEHARTNMYAQLEKVNGSYAGGLKAYIDNAKKLLRESKEGKDPFEGYTASIPSQVIVDIGSQQFYDFEKAGHVCLPHTAFVLVAGGLGERLGYPDIKIKLYTNTVTPMTYAEYYVRAILGLQRIAKERLGKDVTLPLFIMTSGDTHDATMKLMQSNSYFGAKPEQIFIRQQEKVPALLDNNATIASDANGIITKPHGHGDVHTLLHRSGLLKQWLSQGFDWLYFIQDTNALALRAIACLLGISVTEGYAMNSLAVPRLPGEAVGGICKLSRPDGSAITVNVEYNQLDALLRSNGQEGDVAAAGTRYSPYPGNCNILAFDLKCYAELLDVTGGGVPEFVNPKYADQEKNKFKSPTRVECMMQDIARLFPSSKKIGCTVMERWYCFSTVKNNIKDAAIKLAAGGSAESAYTAEADLYASNVKCIMMAAERLKIKASADAPVDTTFACIKYPLGPRVFIDPYLALDCSSVEHFVHASGVREIELKNELDYDIRKGCKSEFEGIKGPQMIELESADFDDPKIPANYKVRGFIRSLTFLLNDPIHSEPYDKLICMVCLMQSLHCLHGKWMQTWNGRILYYVLASFLVMGRAKKTRKIQKVKRLKKTDDRLKQSVKAIREMERPKKVADTRDKNDIVIHKEQMSSALFFQYNQQLGPPYRILLDTNFVNFSIQHKTDIFKGLMDCLLAKCIPTITDCVIGELEKMGHRFRLALRIAKDPRIQRLSCSHKGTYADDCIVNRVTQHRCYIVATNDKDLKRRIRKIPGVPIVYVTQHKYEVERLPDATKSA